MDAISVAKQKPADTKVLMRAGQRAYLARVLALDAKGRTLTEIARDAGLNPTTLTRFYNKGSHTGVLDALTVQRIGEVTGITPETEIAGGLSVSQGNAEPFHPDGADSLSAALRTLLERRPGASCLKLHSREVELAGYLPGDFVIVDPRTAPRNGDLVLAEVLDRRGHAETVWRIFDAPYLVAASTDPAFRKPLVVDNQFVRIRSAVVDSLRHRAA